MQHATGDGKSGKTKRTILQMVMNLPATKLLMDGFLHISTIDTLQHFTNKKYKILCNTFKPYEDKHVKLIPYTRSFDHQNHIYNTIFDKIKAGKRIASVITDQTFATNIKEQIVTQYEQYRQEQQAKGIELKQLKVKLYTGDDGRVNENGEHHITEKIRDFENVNESWKDIDLLIYTTTLTAGVDYSTDEIL